MTEHSYLVKNGQGFPERFLPGRVRSDLPSVELVSLDKVDEATRQEENARRNIDLQITLAENDRARLLGRSSLNPHIFGQ